MSEHGTTQHEQEKNEPLPRSRHYLGRRLVVYPATGSLVLLVLTRELAELGEGTQVLS
jgi:hypothetical protein